MGKLSWTGGAAAAVCLLASSSAEAETPPTATPSTTSKAGEPEPEVATHPYMPLVITGAAVAGTAYAVAVATAAVACSGPSYMCERFGVAFVPVAGPFIALGTGVFDPNRDDSSWPGAQYLYVVDGIVQVVGVGLLITGMVMREPDEKPAAESRWLPSVAVGLGHVSLSLRL